MPYPRVHWSVDGAANELSGTSIYAAVSAANLKVLDGDTFSSASLNSQAATLAVGMAGVVKVDKIGLRAQTWENSDRTVTLYYSTDSSNGSDGAWTALTTVTLYEADNPPYVEYPISPAVDCKWFRFGAPGGYHLLVYHFSVYGEVQNPAYEFYNEAGNAELNTAAYPLTFQPASNEATNSQELKFRIKNTSNATHSYTLSVVPYKATTDTLVSTYITLSTTTVTDLAAGALSNAISVFANIPAAANPADGYHYFSIDVTQS